MLSVTNIIVAITVIISYMAFKNRSMMGKWMFEPFRVKKYGQYYRFISSGFIHADWMHLGVNMFVFWSFGNAVEYKFYQAFGLTGIYYFIMLYLAAIAVSNLKSFIQHADHPHYMSLGASGAVSAVLFARILFDPWTKFYLYGIIEIWAIIAGVLFIVYSQYMSNRRMDNVNHDAHMYGAIFGFVYTILLKPSIGLDFLEKLTQGP